MYYVLIGIGKNLAEAGTFSPAAAYWVPNGIVALGSAVFLYLKSNETSLGITEILSDLYERIRKTVGQSREQ